MKKIMYAFGVEGKEYSRLLSEIEKSREINGEIFEKCLSTPVEDFDAERYQSLDVGEELIGWSSNELPNVPKQKLGKVSGFVIVESLFEENGKEKKGHEIFVGYFDDNPRFEGETDDMDFYSFIDFTDEELINCGWKIAKHWKLSEET